MEGKLPPVMDGGRFKLEEHPRMAATVMLFLQAVTLPGLFKADECNDWQRDAMKYLAPYYAQLKMMAGRCPWSGKQK